MTNTNDWSAVAAAASAAAAFLSLIVACVSLGVAWKARHIQGQSADFANCIEVVEKLSVAMRRVRDAPEEHSRFEFIELLNLLEALAFLHNEKKIAPSTKKFVQKFLEEALGWMRNDVDMRRLMDGSRSSDDTYAELKVFERIRQSEIARHAKSYARQKGLR